MSELAKRLAALCWPSVLAALEAGTYLSPRALTEHEGEEFEHEITEAIYFPIEAELERMALEEKEDAEFYGADSAHAAAMLQALTSNAVGIGLFAENHRKFVSDWGKVKRYLRDHEGTKVELELAEHYWTVRLVSTASGTSESVDVTVYEETSYDMQDAPCPAMLGAWCERQAEVERLARTKKEE